MFEDFIENNLTLIQLEYFIRIITACICGALIGYERTRRQKEAGLRTHIILSMGSAILMIISKYGFLDIAGKILGFNVDGSRVASNIIVSIGFLGAGVIFVRSGSIRGLTTAAGVWTTAAIGMAIGAGLYVLGVGCTFILIIIQVLLHRFVPATEAMETAELFVRVKKEKNAVDVVKEQLGNINIIISSIKVKKNESDIEMRFNIKIYKEYSLQSMISLLAENDNILEISSAF